MYGFFTPDGFVEITVIAAEMIKYLANEPSVGLYYIQEHTQKAVPNLTNLKNTVKEKSRETILHTEDHEDSIVMVRSMKECGSLIADDMIRDIRNSLGIISTKQPKKGPINNSGSEFSIRKSRSFLMLSGSDGESSNYLTNVFKSARDKANTLRWPQAETSLSAEDKETYEQPVSSHRASEANKEDEMEEQDDISLATNKLLLVTDNYEEFKAVEEAKLEAWLGQTDSSPDDGVGLDVAEKL